jgi:hypothetical protein
MEIYLFASDSRPSVSAFTSDKAGSNLPVEYSPWRAANSGNAMLIGSDTDPIAAAVRRDGYFLLSGKARTSHGRRTR